MTDLITRLEAAQAFDVDKDIAYDEENDIRYRYHIRRAPLDKALRECVAVLVDLDREEFGTDYADGHTMAAHEVLSALARVLGAK